LLVERVCLWEVGGFFFVLVFFTFTKSGASWYSEEGSEERLVLGCSRALSFEGVDGGVD